MLGIALATRPHAACIVPERRAERTTEGGLDAAGKHNTLKPLVEELAGAGIRVSLFIAPEARQIDAAARLGAPVVELHTGPYAHSDGSVDELGRLAAAARLAADAGLEVHAGHGLSFANVAAVAGIPELAELNIGHFLIGEAVFTGLETAIAEMRRLMMAARAC
jgi:pyridoxine 5-phosphate synthase